MAKSRILSFPTSPRIPKGVFGDLILLKQLENRVWDKETQLEYARDMFQKPKQHLQQEIEQEALNS